MQINDRFFYINIRDYLALGNDSKAGEPMLTRVLSGFSCHNEFGAQWGFI